MDTPGSETPTRAAHSHTLSDQSYFPGNTPPKSTPPKRAAHSHTLSDPPGRKRVGFISDTPTPDDRISAARTPDEIPAGNGYGWENGNQNGSRHILRSDISHDELSKEIHKAMGEPFIPKPRPAIRKTERASPTFYLGDEEDVNKKRSGLEAQKRAAQLSKSVGTFSTSAPGSRRNSSDRLFDSTPSIELKDMSRESLEGNTTDQDEGEEALAAKREFLEQADKLLRETVRHPPIVEPEDLYHSDATPTQSGQVTPINEMEIDDEHIPRPPKYRTGVLGTLLRAANMQASGSGATTPTNNGRNKKASGHGRNLSSQSLTFSKASTAASTPDPSPPESGATTPSRSRPKARPWHSKSANNSTTSISRLIESSSMLSVPAQKDSSQSMKEASKKPQRPGMGKRNISASSITSTISKITKRDEQFKIKIHLAGTLARQNYLRKLCKALMMYGAPTHRLEEYMNMSARVLEIEAQFLYMPGCMICAFDDSSVHTSEVKLVRATQGVDLGKLQDVHEIYKDVVHDRIAVDKATPRLEAIIARKPKFHAWVRVVVYGFASATVGPFAFGARLIDLPFCFILGCLLGWLQLILAPQNELISNVFEVSAAVMTSFIARGLGSIRGADGKEIFCFSAMAQSSIALILPGFTVLSASLELQSRHIVAGSVRMVYAIIYSLFLGFGITIGTVLFGMMYKDATSTTTCRNPMNPNWYYFFVLGFSLCLIIINQAKYKQIPAMMVISLIGYVVSYHSSHSIYFRGNAQVSSTLGALAIGVSANLHARFGKYIENWSLDHYENSLRPRWMRLRKRWLRRSHGPTSKIHAWTHDDASTSRSSSQDRLYSHSRNSSTQSIPYVPRTRKIGFGLAAAAMLPAIFVQVPSGLSVSGSLVSGITSADQMTRNTTGVTTVSATENSGELNSVALNVGFSVIQVAIGITVGLFLAALIVYPLGKRRSGLFSF